MESLQKIVEELAKWFEAIAYIVLAVVALVVVWVLWAVFSRKRKSPRRKRAVELEIDYRSLGDKGPPAGPLKLEFLGIPVRLAAVVLAPSGRLGNLPPEQDMPELFSSIIPGLEQVVNVHEPLIRLWPRQLSHRGFAQKFFAKVRLPGEFGAGTPWCSVAGELRYRGVSMLAGLVLRSATANHYGQKRVEQPYDWHQCLRISGLYQD